jgi:hypothetical protein
MLVVLTQTEAGSPSVKTDTQDGPVTTSSLSKSNQATTLPVDIPVTFTLFPKLPIELRLKIWQLSFPSCHEVNFAAIRTLSLWRGKEVTEMEDNLPLPISLSINQESRRETLKHYSVVLRSGYTGTARHREIEKPFYYNPKLDVAWLAPFIISDHYPERWLAYLQSVAPRVFANTKTLEVRAWDWSSGYMVLDFRGFLPAWSFYNIRPDDAKMKSFLRFTNLEEVKLIRSTEFSSVNLIRFIGLTEEEVDIWVAMMRAWFEKNKDAFAAGVPVISVE